MKKGRPSVRQDCLLDSVGLEILLAMGIESGMDHHQKILGRQSNQYTQAVTNEDSKWQDDKQKRT